MAVTLALAFPTKRMTYEKLLVCVLGSCETMANASVVCTDKSGTLTQNVMTVVAGSVGICLWTTLRKASARSHQPPPYSPITPSPRNLFGLNLDDKTRFEKLSILAQSTTTPSNSGDLTTSACSLATGTWRLWCWRFRMRTICLG